MQRAVIWFLCLAVVLALPLFAAPVYIGDQVKARFTENMNTQRDYLHKLNLELRTVSYQQELYGARAKVLYADRETGSTLCSAVHDIRHGPFLFSKSVFGLAAIDSRIEIPEHLKKKHLSIADNASPLTAESLMGFDGSVTSSIASPQLSWHSKQIGFSWDSLQGNLLAERNSKKRLFLDLRLPNLELKEPKSKSRYLLEQVGLNSSWKQDREGENGNQTFSLTADRFTTQAGSASGPSMRSFTVSSSGQWSQGMMNSSLELRFAAFKAGALSLEQGVLQASLENLNQSAMQRFLKLAQASEKQEAKPSLATISELQRLAVELLRSSPSLEISRLQFQTGNGTVSLQGRLGYQSGGEALSLKDEKALLDRLKGEADLAVPKDFAVRIISVPLSFSALLEPDKHQGFGQKRLDTYAAERARAWLGILRSTGFIEKSGARYSTRASLDNGRLAVNGIQMLDLNR